MQALLQALQRLDPSTLSALSQLGGELTAAQPGAASPRPDLSSTLSQLHGDTDVQGLLASLDPSALSMLAQQLPPSGLAAILQSLPGIDTTQIIAFIQSGGVGGGARPTTIDVPAEVTPVTAMAPVKAEPDTPEKRAERRAERRRAEKQPQQQLQPQPQPQPPPIEAKLSADDFASAGRADDLTPESPPNGALKPS